MRSVIADLDSSIIDQITYFIISYNKLSNKVFKPLKNEGPSTTIEIIKNSIKKEIA